VAGVVQEHLILGVDERDLQNEIGRWLTENPDKKVLEAIIQQEPRNLLARIGGRNVPRFSMLVRYHTVRHPETPLSPTSFPFGESHDGDRSDGKNDQSRRQDLLSG
jgi:hypothetical protein